MILYKMINLLSKTYDFIKEQRKFGNKKWKGVKSQKKVFPLF